MSLGKSPKRVCMVLRALMGFLRSLLISSGESDDNQTDNNKKDVYWSPMRIKRTLEDSSSNKLAMMEVIRVNICFTYPELQFAEPKSEPQIIDDMAAFIKEAETKTCLLKLVRCRYSPSYTDECPKSSNNQIFLNAFLDFMNSWALGTYDGGCTRVMGGCVCNII